MRSIFYCLLGLLFATISYGQGEYIKSFDVQITVNKDRSIDITEFISVVTDNTQIKRGITRNIPLRRRMRSGKISKLIISNISVEKGGQKEPYHTDDTGSSLKMYLGERDVLLDPGQYDYKIQYSVASQIDFFDDYDELYWNAIGTDVIFEIEASSCRVQLPVGVNIIQESAYVGKYGSQDKDYTVTTEQDRILDYRISRKLNPNEGLSIGIGFEKGLVEPISFLQRFGTLLVILGGLLLLLPYYLYTWITYGRDPQAPASYPIFESPDNLSPASVSYLSKEGVRSVGFTSSIVALAIKGYIRVLNHDKSQLFGKKRCYNLVKQKDIDPREPKEQVAIFNKLFKQTDDVIIDGEYIEEVEKAYDSHNSALKQQHHELLDRGNNRNLLWIPIIITIVAAITGIVTWNRSPNAEQFNLYALIAFAVFAIVAFFIYIYLIKRPAEEKLDIKSRIQGFQMYLNMVEKNRLDLVNPPEMTPEHFEHILPYAYALGVEHIWSNAFKTILEQAKYVPNWNDNGMHFDAKFGPSFTKDVSSSSTVPSSSGSGGSGGGGFSGGGGGGGGVGGW